MKRKNLCFYCGKPTHFAKDCKRMKFDESNHRRYLRNFVDKDSTISDCLENPQLFISKANGVMHGLLNMVLHFI